MLLEPVILEFSTKNKIYSYENSRNDGMCNEKIPLMISKADKESHGKKYKI